MRTLVLVFTIASLAVSLVSCGGKTDREDMGCYKVERVSKFYPGPKWTIDSVVASATSTDRVYAVTNGGRLFASTGERTVSWRESRTRAPGELTLSQGSQRDTLYAVYDRVFRSANGGRSWKGLTCGLLVNSIAVADHKPQVIYVATSSSLLDSTIYGGLYRSEDGGRSWKRFTDIADMSTFDMNIYYVAADPNTPHTVYITTSGTGVWLSRDGGGHWSWNRVTAKRGRAGAKATSLAIGGGKRPTLWLGTNRQGVFSSRVGSSHWSRRGLRGQIIDQIVPDQKLENVVYALSEEKGFLRTIDGGRHWQRIAELPRNVDGLTLQSLSGTVYAWNKQAIFRSRDHGATWTRLPSLPR